MLSLLAPSAAANLPGTPAATIKDWGIAGSTVVTTSTGKIRGKHGVDASGAETAFWQAFGIPIAQDSSGPNRWKPPQPLTSTDTTDCFEERMCLHDNGGNLVGTEDCISVDVASPDLDATNPIFFWIHGGGFNTQNPYNVLMPTITPHHYAAGPKSTDGPKTPDDAVLVIAHYRLAAMGWLASPAFTGEDFDGNTLNTGNWGMTDTIKGIEWTLANAAAIGGDKDKITVGGESAGAAHVTMLMASPMIPFVKAFIAESPFIVYYDVAFSLKARQEMDMAYFMRAGCSSDIKVPSPSSTSADAKQANEKHAACMRGKTSEGDIELLMKDIGFSKTEPYVCDGGYTAPPAYGGTCKTDPTNPSPAVVKAFEAMYGTGIVTIWGYNSIHHWPVVDGVILPMSPLKAYSTSTINKQATILTGYNADEFTTFCNGAGQMFACGMGPNLVDQAVWIGFFGLSLDAGLADIYASVMKAYLDTNVGGMMSQLKGGLFYADVASPAKKAIQMASDAILASGTYQITRAFDTNEKFKGKTYSYFFAQETDAGGFAMLMDMGACHGCELTYVLGFYTVQSTYILQNLISLVGVDLKAMGMADQMPMACNGPYGPPCLKDYKIGADPDPTAAPMIPSLRVDDPQNFFYNPYDAARDMLGDTMKYYWKAIFSTQDPNGYTKPGHTIADVGLPKWEPTTLADYNVMVFQAAYPKGAALNPCIAPNGCSAPEPAKNMRVAVKKFWADQGDAMVALPDSCTTEVTGVKTFSSDPACPAYVCASWCNAWTTGMDACASCPVKNYLAAGAYCSPWCNVYTCGMGMCHGCQMCQDYLNSKYCAPWCNAYTCWAGVCAGCAACA